MQNDDTVIAALERRIAAVRGSIDDLERKSFRLPVSEGLARLRAEECVLRAELRRLRPYEIVHNFNHYVIAHNGMFVKDAAGEWMQFATEDEAQGWINTKIARAAAA